MGALAEGRLRLPERLAARLRDGGERIVVTGAGGWLGRATLEMLDEAFGPGLANRVVAFAAADRAERLRSGRTIPLHALARLADLPASAPTIVVHYAFLTREKTLAMAASDYVAANRGIVALMAAACRRLGARGAFSTSSGAVYGPGRTPAPDLAANPYGTLKLEEEGVFAGLGVELGAPAARCRVFNLGGPFLNKEYALGSFLRAGLGGEPLLVRAPRPVRRSYAHVGDVVAAGLGIALGSVPDPGAPYDTAGAETVEVAELAVRVRSVLGRPDLPILRPSFDPDAPPDDYVGDGRAFAGLVAACGGRLASLDAQIGDTAAYLRGEER